MELAIVTQITAACVGFIGSIFFCIGVLRQSVAEMAKLAGTYWDWNSAMVRSLGAQKSEYFFGGGILAMAFLIQLASFFVPQGIAIQLSAKAICWAVIPITLVVFYVLWRLSRHLAGYYERKISEYLKADMEKHRQHAIQKR